jgi:hypothetical protein
MWGTRSNCEEKWLFSIDGVFEEAVCLLSKYVCDVLTFIASGCLAFPLKGTIEIIVREWVK